MHCQRRGEERRAHSPAAHLTVSEALSPADPKTHNGLSRVQNKTPTPTDRTRTQLVKAAASRCPNPGRPALVNNNSPQSQRSSSPRRWQASQPHLPASSNPPTHSGAASAACLHARERDHVRQSIFSVRPLARTRGARRGGAATAQCRRPRPRAEPRETRCLMPGRA